MNITSARHRARLGLSAMTVTLLAACFGGGGDGNGNDADTQAVKGVLVQPQGTAAASASILARQGRSREQAASAACPAVPDGYDPLANVTVSFRDASDAEVATLTTDACGNFAGDIPSTATTVKAAPTGTTPIEQPVSGFTGADPTLASVMPATADLVISVLQDLGGGKVALSVTDSLTGKAVLGLSGANFAFSTAGAAATPTGVAYGASTAQSASVGLVLDSSGSMAAFVGTTGKTRNQLAAAASHELLNGLTSGADDAGVVIFGNTSTVINDASLALLPWVDANGVTAPAYTFSTTGITSTISQLRPIADLYDWESAMYPGGTDPVHADTGTLRLGYRPFGGNTAYYDGTSDGLALVALGANTRKIVVALTDGENNSSRKTIDTVITEAKTAGIPLYTVAFGEANEVDETGMQRMASETGGEYKRVEGADVTGLFQSIQTGIRFQYVASFASAFPATTVLTSTVSAGGKQATRDLTIR